jgi:transposase
MGKFTLVGADVHDRSILGKVAVDGGAMEKRSWGNDGDGRRAMIADLKRRAAEAGATEIRFVYEASGLGFGLYDELTDAGIRCDVLAPTKIERSPHTRKQKTDEKDAERLLEVLRGHVLAGNRLPAIWIPDLETRDDRELTRARLDVGEKISGAKAQVKSLLKRNGVRRGEGTGKGWSLEYWLWLGRLAEKGDEVGSGARVVLKSLLNQLNFLEEEAVQLDKAIEELAQLGHYAGSAKELLKLKGVGLLTAMVFLTEVGDLKRFQNRRQVGAYMGLVPCTAESGEASDRKGHITREGPGRLRKVLCQAAWARVRSDPDEKKFYGRMVERNPKRKKKAVVAVMRRLAIRMWHAGLRGKEAAAIEQKKLSVQGQAAVLAEKRTAAADKVPA